MFILDLYLICYHSEAIATVCVTMKHNGIGREMYTLLLGIVGFVAQALVPEWGRNKDRKSVISV